MFKMINFFTFTMNIIGALVRDSLFVDGYGVLNQIHRLKEVDLLPGIQRVKVLSALSIYERHHRT